MAEFPAPAGINRLLILVALVALGVPRASGDKPPENMKKLWEGMSSHKR